MCGAAATVPPRPLEALRPVPRPSPLFPFLVLPPVPLTAQSPWTGLNLLAACPTRPSPWPITCSVSVPHRLQRPREHEPHLPAQAGASACQGGVQMACHWKLSDAHGNWRLEAPASQQAGSGAQAALRSAPGQGQRGQFQPQVTLLTSLGPICWRPTGGQKRPHAVVQQGHPDVSRPQSPAGPWEVPAPHSLAPEWRGLDQVV